ncbi:DnaJ / Sec63 Brl domains-containing protein [Theobroma cacao]|uniref:DnaJ / Sec63 Brl domains-containing protein n=1 Tax=Theobroma cacao TaxID=3641 RepID=A0A061EU56_THECC|nr:DnaJ / Sec63 Brl domains-containing protein [Theobroma cacao]
MSSARAHAIGGRKNKGQATSFPFSSRTLGYCLAIKIGLQMGIALPPFLLNIDGASGGILLLGIVGVCILLPLVLTVIYLSRSAKYTGNYVMHQTLSAYCYFMKPSLAPSKVLDVFIKAAEFMEIPVRQSDGEPLLKLFMLVRSELNLDLKNIRQEQAKFWKQHPAFVKTALIPRTARGHGWLRPAIGVVELSQNIIQAVPLSARKIVGGSSEGIAPFLQLPYFNEAMVKKIARKKMRTFQDFCGMTLEDRVELLTKVAGLSTGETKDVEMVLEMMPSLTMDVTCETEGEEGIQEGDIVMMHAWITLKLGSSLVASFSHAPYFPFHKEENFWLLVADSVSNDVWISQKVSFMDEAVAITAASKAIQELKEGSGASLKETNAAVREAVEKVRKDKLKDEIMKQSRAGTRTGPLSEEGSVMEEGIGEEEEEEDGYDDY